MTLAEILLAHAGPARAGLAALPDLEAVLQDVVATARTTWPQIDVDPAVFLRHLAERLPADADAGAALRGICAADLYLACACAQGNATAVAALDQSFIAPIGSAGRDGAADPAGEELRQNLRARLLVGADGKPPRIAGYTGRGPLSAWIRVAAARVTVDMQRAAKPADSIERYTDLRAAGPDPEIAYLKVRYGRALEEVFEATVAALSPREANVLRLSSVEGMTAKAIAAAYKVSERTVQRWIADVRQKVFEETHRRLAERLRLTDTEVRSLYQFVRSQVALNLPGDGER